ncbi:hypothetical protein ACFLXU_02435 [Chloroflexota bacterium]
MFYDHPSFRREVQPQVKLESAIVTLNPAESKRLIAKAVCNLPEVEAACKKGTLVIAWGTTNALVAEEILGKTIVHKTDFASGVICDGELKVNHPDTKIMPFVLKDGTLSKVHQKAALSEFKPGDVFIKGANAVDTKGDIGILAAAHYGGLAQEAWFAVVGRGGCFICPVGLEKLVPSVNEATQKCGIFRFKYSIGLPVALVTFSTAKVVTEIQAIKVLTGASATHVASGGIGGSEGAVTLVVEGEASVLEQAFELVKSVKGEPPLPPPRQYTVPPAASLGYDAQAISELFQQFVSKGA